MNYFNYFTEIEEEFVKRRGSHLLVSPLDWSLMETWKQRGVPLHIVLRGINASFDAYDQRASRGRRVNSLFYCQQEVESSYLEYCESRVGSNDGEENGSPASVNGGKNGHSRERSPFNQAVIVDYLSEQAEAVEAVAKKLSGDSGLAETLERVKLRLDHIIEDLRSSKNVSPESIEIDLTMIEEVILDGLKEGAGDEKIEQLRKEGHQQLKAYRQNMEDDVYRQTLDNFIARRLREHYRIPRLSLFYL